jgi:hypothetical protein
MLFVLDPDPTYKLVSDQDPKPVSDPSRISYILDINFIFVSRLLSVLGCLLKK